MNKTLLLLISLTLLGGCAATGKKFTSVEAATETEGLIYFYRPHILTGSGVDMNILNNNRLVTTIENQQFIKYSAAPGVYNLHLDIFGSNQKLELPVEPGETYFVRLGFRTGAFVNSWFLSRIYPNEAIRELQDCCRTGEL